ncbi:hypothetical protein DyAD56_02125 [Dyella sp. AD56]|nr:hypothetical protein DyAD56_02125 [Dyella sp. AD56]
MLPVMFFLGSELAYATQGCGSVLYRRQLDESEAQITHAVMFEPAVGEMPTRNGSYECVRFSFLVDATGRPVDIRAEVDSGGIAFEARRALEQFRFRPPKPGSHNRLMLVFDGMSNRWPSLPPDLR